MPSSVLVLLPSTTRAFFPYYHNTHSSLKGHFFKLKRGVCVQKEPKMHRSLLYASFPFLNAAARTLNSSSEITGDYYSDNTFTNTSLNWCASQHSCCSTAFQQLPKDTLLPSTCSRSAELLGKRNCACRRSAFRFLWQDGMRRCWRRQPKPLCALHARCTASNVGHGDTDATACRQKWYQRQLRAQTLNPVDLIPLAQRLPNRQVTCFSAYPVEQKTGAMRSAAGSADAMADAFLSCCASPLCDANVLQSVFMQLSAEHQCNILSRGPFHSMHQRLPLFHRCIEEALRNKSFSPEHWIRVLSSVQVADAAHPLPVDVIMKHIFQRGAKAFASEDDTRLFIAKALRLMECQKMPFASIVECLKSSGLSYEACAYASSSSAFVVPPAFATVVEAAEGHGYGPLIHSMCALPKPPLKWFSAVRGELPPALQRYSALVLLQAAVRKCGGVVRAEDNVWRQFTAELLSPLEAASALHFLLREGTTLTAQLLISHCHTAQQVITLMRYTHNVQNDLAFQAVTALLAMRTVECVVVHLRLESRERRTTVVLSFDAQLGGCEVSTRRCARLAQQSVAKPLKEGFFTPKLPLGMLDRSLIHQYLRDTLPHSVLVRGERSLSQMMAAVPATAVEHVAASLPMMHGDALSWWVSLYLKGGNLEGAFAVLAVIAVRGCLPHMEVLVELLECTQNDTEKFVRSVTLIQQDFTEVADTVLRAFVERAATLMIREAGLASATVQAVHTLKSLAVMGLPQLPARCLSDLATHNARDTLHALLALAQKLRGGGRHAVEVAPLDVAAIAGLAAAGRQLRYRVCISAVALSAGGGAYAGWWGTASRPLQSLTRFEYATQDLSLWPWVKKEAVDAFTSLSWHEVHKAVRIVALGSRNAKVSIDFWTAAKERLEWEKNEGRLSRRMQQAREDSEACTAACVYAVCIAQGQKQLASHVLRSCGNSGRSRAPPVLAALSRTFHGLPCDQERRAIARAHKHYSTRSRKRLPCCSAVDRLGHRKNQKGGAKTTHTNLMRFLPPTLQRLVVASGAEIAHVFFPPNVPRNTSRRGK